MKIVVVSPHRDDAAFSLGLSIGCWLDGGHTVTVLNCFTRSDYAPYAEFEFIHSNDRLPRVSALRLREDERWQKMYGGKLKLVDLNLKDAPLRFHVGVDQVISLAVNPDDKAMSKISKAMEALKGDAMVLPLALGSHVDHKTARDAMRPAASSADMPVAFYEDLPYATWPEMAETIRASAVEIDAELAPAFVTQEGSIADAIARKRRLALCYDSQISDDVAETIAGFCGRYGGRERLWANGAWRGTELGKGDAR